MKIAISGNWLCRASVRDLFFGNGCGCNLCGCQIERQSDKVYNKGLSRFMNRGWKIWFTETLMPVGDCTSREICERVFG